MHLSTTTGVGLLAHDLISWQIMNMPVFVVLCKKKKGGNKNDADIAC